MSSNQQVSNFIYYYPKVLDSQICNSIIKILSKGGKHLPSLQQNQTQDHLKLI